MMRDLHEVYELVIPIKVYMIFISLASKMAKNGFTCLKPVVRIHFCVAQTCNAAFTPFIEASTW